MVNQQAKNGYYITCEDVFKIYKIADLEVVALRGLDLLVQKKEVMAIVGASGSGKTTLLNILGGLDNPTAGKVMVGERDLVNISARDLGIYRRKDVGFVWQQTGRNLIPYLTAFQNVELPLTLLGWSPRKRKQRATEMLDAVGLSSRMNHQPERLSVGEQQRVAIAVALAHNPPLLLADEPTGELDSQSAGLILDIFHSLNETYGVTVIIVTHDVSITGKVDRVVTIRDGRTSIESVRGTKRGEEQAEQVVSYEEFIVLDGAGRLQLPREYVDKLGMKGRVRVLLEEDHVTVWPEQNNNREGGK
ncbi:MAG: ABC transporter ATP-binding protein [Dehalococcoidales bacterium]|nr:MAG: ABC transporter ATP-binding protein [Dehalococcoidales bacterium]